MRVALIQVRLNPGSPAANVQRITRYVDQAAASVPAPDVIVLPAACDSGGGAPETPCPAERACFAQTLASKAREWGVYIACGLHDGTGASVRPVAVVFDRDGDVAAWDAPGQKGGAMSLADQDAAPTADAVPTVKAMHTVHTPAGAIRVALTIPIPAEDPAEDAAEDAAEHDAAGLIVVPSHAGARRVGLADADDRSAARHRAPLGAYVARACPPRARAGSGSGFASALWDDRGRTVCGVPPGEEGFVLGEAGAARKAPRESPRPDEDG